MKNLFRLLCLSLFLCLTSCIVNDDFDDLSTPLEGTWLLTTFDIGIPLDLNGDGNASSDIIAETNCYQNETISFASDFTGVIVTRSYADIEVTFVTGSTDQVEYSVDCIPDLFNQNIVWSRNGNSVTLDIDNITLIASIASNKLTFVLPQGFSIESPDNGMLITLTQDVTLTYTKQ